MSAGEELPLACHELELAGMLWAVASALSGMGQWSGQCALECLHPLVLSSTHPLCLHSYLDDMTPERVDAGGVANVAAAAAKYLQVCRRCRRCCRRRSRFGRLLWRGRCCFG